LGEDALRLLPPRFPFLRRGGFPTSLLAADAPPFGGFAPLSGSIGRSIHFAAHNLWKGTLQRLIVSLPQG
jgi:hypothetical protein